MANSNIWLDIVINREKKVNITENHISEKIVIYTKSLTVQLSMKKTIFSLKKKNPQAMIICKIKILTSHNSNIDQSRYITQKQNIIKNIKRIAILRTMTLLDKLYIKVQHASLKTFI